MKQRMARAYERLSPPEEGLEVAVRSIVARSLWPGRLRRWRSG